MKEEEKTIDNELELRKSFLDVNSDIGEHINADFVQARIEDNEREYTVEMTFTANRTKQILKKLLEYEIDYWNNETQKWGKRNLNTNELDEISKDGIRIFDNFLIKTQTNVIMKRNVPNNHLLKLVAKAPDEDEGIEPQELISLKEKIKLMQQQPKEKKEE